MPYPMQHVAPTTVTAGPRRGDHARCAALLRLTALLSLAAACAATAAPPAKLPGTAAKSTKSTASALVAITPAPALTARTIAPHTAFRSQDRALDALRPTSTNRSTGSAPNACSADSSMLCYDYRTGRAVFKPTRHLVPPIPGLKAESITLKRDKLAINYSF
jgi:hypothetical protein